MKPFDQFRYYLALSLINIATLIFIAIIISTDLDLIWKLIIGVLLLGFYHQETMPLSRLNLWKAGKETEEKEKKERERIEPFFESNTPTIVEIVENKNSWGKLE